MIQFLPTQLFIESLIKKSVSDDLSQGKAFVTKTFFK